MQVVIKPILAMIFIVGIIWMLNYVFIFITVMQMDLVLTDVAYIIEEQDGYTEIAASEINEVLNNYSKQYQVSVTNDGSLDYGETTEVTITHYYDYFGMKKIQELSSSLVIMGKEV